MVELTVQEMAYMTDMDLWIKNQKIIMKGAERDVEDYENILINARQKVLADINYFYAAIASYNDWRKEHDLEPITLDSD